MAWKGTRPEPVRKRDEDVFKYLQDKGPSSRNKISGPEPEGLGLSRSLTYLSLDRLRRAGRVKRCMAEDSNELLWTAQTEVPCP